MDARIPREGKAIQKTDGLGRLALPADMRNRLGITPESALLLRKSGPHSLELEVIPETVCVLCRSGRSLFETDQGYICKDCLLNLLDQVLLRRDPDVDGEPRD